MTDDGSDDDWYQPYASGTGRYGTGNTSVPGSPYTQPTGAHVPNTVGPSPADDEDEDESDDEDGDYKCTVCEWSTDIDNEHRSRPQHWCGDCGEIQRFEHDPE